MPPLLPRFISILCQTLTDHKITEEKINSVASITYILESYIKKSIKKILSYLCFVNKTKKINFGGVHRQRSIRNNWDPNSITIFSY